MALRGCGVDPVGRALVESLKPPGVHPIRAPDLLVLSPEGELLGRAPFNADVVETLRVLRSCLAARPDLAPIELPEVVYDVKDPAQRALVRLEERWQAGERAELIGPSRWWLDRFGGAWEHGTVTARYWLGVALYHKGQHQEAREHWTAVAQEYPNHPLKHRAIYNMLDFSNWLLPQHPDIRGALPEASGPIVVPDLACRDLNLARVTEELTYRVSASGLPMVRIPEGRFTMGGQPAYFQRELPLRQVTISRPFWIAAWPVTRELWRGFRPEDFPERRAAADLPIIVSFDDARNFCRFLSELDGVMYRLPTEAEWEYAARGGMEGAPFPWGHEPVDEKRCNYRHSSGVPVASYPPNDYGLFDMVGNVPEWCQDVFLEDAYALTPEEVVDPVVLQEGAGDHVTRGGLAGLEFCHLMCRNALRLTGPKAGIRVVAEDNP